MVVYLFDRCFLSIGSILPPHPYWAGTPLRFFGQNELAGLWMRSPEIGSVEELQRAADRQVERALAEGRSRLLARLEYLDERFSRSASGLLYAKGLLLESPREKLRIADGMLELQDRGYTHDAERWEALEREINRVRTHSCGYLRLRMGSLAGAYRVASAVVPWLTRR